MKQRCLVIGANGFIGSHLVDELIEAGFIVRAFDRFSRDIKFNSNSEIEIIKGNIYEDMIVSTALKDVDYVFYSFSATTPISSDADPYTDINSNILRSIQIFEKAIEHNIKKIVFLSSGGAVYGPVAEHESVSEANVPNPVSPYGIGKLASEHYLAYFNRKYNLDYIVYRLSNPYGPRQATKSNQGVIPIFINKIKQNEPLQILGDGTSSRDFIYIRDATRMIVETFARDTRHRTYNVASGSQAAINDIVSEITKITGTNPKVNYMKAPATFLQKTQLNIDRYEQEFGNLKLTTLAEGLKRTIDKM